MQNSKGEGGRHSGTRREPSFGCGRALGRQSEDCRLRPEDRPQQPQPRKASVTPAVKPVAERAGRKASGSRKGQGQSRSRKEDRRHLSLVGRLVVWSFTLCIWGMIGFAGLVGYYFTKLPPIDQ